ncbi:MAG TPA: hypothetical protein VLF17_00925 [Candidatus Nitrosotenuis sp.]|nr:hypothetical protein [Candidatus Nitrosotenuis sp.]
MNSQILDKVVESGVCGIKKAELKKIFGNECEPSLAELANNEQVIVDNKGVAHYVWTKENYLSHISQNDPKFKILSKLVKNLENSVNQMRSQISAEKNDLHVPFQTQFDGSISKLSSSLGWVPLSEVRQKVCDSLKISQEEFYALASSLIESNQAKYEISTGGKEGIIVRGMLHGYVRKI